MTKLELLGWKIEYEYFDWEHEIEEDDSDYEYIHDMLAEGYVEGELSTYDGEEDHRGWWKKL